MPGLFDAAVGAVNDPSKQNTWLDYLRTATQFGAGGTQGREAGGGNAGGSYHSNASSPNSMGQNMAMNALSKMGKSGGAGAAAEGGGGLLGNL